MHCKYFFVFFLLFYAELNIADNNAWDCEKVAGGEWICASQTPPVVQPAVQVEAQIKNKKTTTKETPLPTQAFVSPTKLTHTLTPPLKKISISLVLPVKQMKMSKHGVVQHLELTL